MSFWNYRIIKHKDKLTHYGCTECGGIVMSGLCTYGCKYDGKYMDAELKCNRRPKSKVKKLEYILVSNKMTPTEILQTLIESARGKICSGHEDRFHMNRQDWLLVYLKNPCAYCGRVLELVHEMRKMLEGVSV